MAGEVHAEEGALIDFAVNVKKAAVLLDDAIDRGQTHASALAVLLGGEKGFEDMFASLRVHAEAGVADGEYCVGARSDIGGRNGNRFRRAEPFPSRW